MRPKKLIMQAFGSYGKKTEIDFTKSKQNLFLITGDTGAGKTTIFDAIVFALYGKSSSGYNNKSGEELQSQFVDYGNEPFVEFIFTEKSGTIEEEYKVRRIPKHLRPYKRGREGYTDETEKVFLFFSDNTEYSHNLSDTNNKIIEIIKLNKNQFMQVSMIAQGEFMEVLRGGDKQAIFRKLFNTEIYEDLTNKLRDRSNDKNVELKKFSSECQIYINSVRLPECVKGAYDSFEMKKEYDITDIEKAKDSLNKLCMELDKIIEDKQREDKEAFLKNEKIKKELTEGKQLLEFFESLSKAENEVKKLEDRKEEVLNLEKLVKDMEAAFELEGLYTNLAEADKKYENAKNELKQKQKALPELISKYEEISKNEELARAKLSTKVEEYNIISEKVRTALENLKNLEARKKEKSLQEIEREKAVKSSEEAKLKLSEFEKLEKAWREAIKELSSLQKMDLKLEDRLNSVRKAGDELKSLMAESEALILEIEKIKKLQLSYDKEYLRFKEAEDEFIPKRRLFYESSAGLIARDFLYEGKPCPVCGSLSHPAPCKLPEGVKEIKKEDIDELERRLDKLNDDVKTKLSELDGCKIKVAEREKRLRADEEKLKRLVNEEFFEFDALTESDKAMDLQRLYDEMNLFSYNLQKEKNELNTKIKELKFIEEKLATAEEKKLILKQAEEEAKAREIQLVKELSGIEASIREIETGLYYRTKEEAKAAGDFEAKEKNKAEVIYKELEERSKEAKSFKEQTETLITKLMDDLPELERIKEVKRMEYEESIADKKITGEQWKIITKEHKRFEKDELQSIINKYKGDRIASENIVVKMKEAIKDREKPDISKLQSESEMAVEAYEKLHTELEEIRADYRVDKEILEKLESALKERISTAREYALINRLYTRLSGKVSGAKMDIETFVQRRFLEKILVSANKRFSSMSAGQFELRIYELEKAGAGINKGLNLMVYSYITGKSRDVRTLSGGESFMAALSLALGMADQIQERSGAVNLEMMFVDEGFGTLDDNSRNQAIKILKNMAGGSKLIGIISHVSELKQEIDEQLVVTKDEKGSRVNWRLS